MKREEIEQAIEKGESVWYIVNNELAEIDLSCNFHEIKDNELSTWYDKYSKDYYTHRKKLEDLYKSQAEAEHYLHHANVERVEKLPFLTWEEFKNKYKDVVFTDPKGVKYYLMKCVFWCPETNNVEYCISIKYGENYLTKIEYDYTEQNFYKAYDECVRLFKEEE